MENSQATQLEGLSLSEARDRIDAIDEKLLGLLNDRALLARHIGALKKKSSLGFHVPERERAVIERLKRLNAESASFPSEAIGPVFREIMSACLHLESPIVVAYLGPGTTFSYLALRRAFGSSALAQPEPTIDDVFDSIEKGRSDYALIPLENSFEGSVTASMQRMLKTEAAIHAEVYLPVSHNLAALEFDLRDIRKVCSHPQALAQCRNWIKNHLPDVELVETSSTSQACSMAKADKHTAAICTPQAALEAGLVVVSSNIQDREENETRFLILSKEKKLENRSTDKTSIVFSVPDVHGKLASILNIFSSYGVNLKKLESVPNRKSPWKASFWVDFQGTQGDSAIEAALKDVEAHCEAFKVLGSYSIVD